ncbi:hypothetical protein B0H19DRAFT_1251872 [Mycena capillaripes]|nr:hypothetical protein B0H19DRAFT_1251872 [Mycena capillaripes]
MDGSQHPHYFWDGSEGQQRALLLDNSTSVSDGLPSFTFHADYVDPTRFVAQPAQPLDLPPGV